MQQKEQKNIEILNFLYNDVKEFTKLSKTNFLSRFHVKPAILFVLTQEGILEKDFKTDPPKYRCILKKPPTEKMAENLVKKYKEYIDEMYISKLEDTPSFEIKDHIEYLRYMMSKYPYRKRTYLDLICYWKTRLSKRLELENQRRATKNLSAA